MTWPWVTLILGLAVIVAGALALVIWLGHKELDEGSQLRRDSRYG